MTMKKPRRETSRTRTHKMKNLMKIEQNKKAYHDSVSTLKPSQLSFNARFDNSDPFE